MFQAISRPIAATFETVLPLAQAHAKRACQRGFAKWRSVGIRASENFEKIEKHSG